jgi:hypothetical protein
VSELFINSPDIGTDTAADFGLYQTTANGGAVVDADFFAAAVSLNGGAIAASDITHGAGFTITKAEQMIWEALGLSSDPQIMYDVAATLTADADATGIVAVKCYWVY